MCVSVGWCVCICARGEKERAKEREGEREHTASEHAQLEYVFFTGFSLTGKIVWMLPGVRRVIKSFAGTLDSCQSPCQLVPL